MSDGDVTFDGNPVTLSGQSVQQGEKAPEFSVLADLGKARSFDGEAADDAVRIFTTALSIDTPVCAKQFNKFDERAGELADEGIEVWYITRDLPFALQRHAQQEGVENVEFFSDYKDEEFGEKFGVTVDEFGLLARATFVVDQNGKVVYREICSEIGEEPDYESAVEAARAAKGGT